MYVTHQNVLTKQKFPHNPLMIPILNVNTFEPKINRQSVIIINLLLLLLLTLSVAHLSEYRINAKEFQLFETGVFVLSGI